MDQFPDITLPAEVKEDLEIIETEDLKSDPFVRQPPIKPPAPVPETPKPKAKRQVSEKQKAHLANARKLARERKLAKKKEETTKEEPKQDIKEYAQKLPPAEKTDAGLPASMATPKVDGFEQFLGYMNKYGDMMINLQKEEQRKREEEERKEKELEAKYFKKFQEQHGVKKSEPKPETTKKIPKKSLDILNPPQNDFGQYSSYF